MKVYKHDNGRSHTLIVTPGKHRPEVSSWHDDKGRAMIFPVKFSGGVAEVDDQLGKFLIDQNLVSKSPVNAKDG